MNRKDRKYSELFSSYYPLVYNTVCLKVNDRDDAEDITQNVFVKFYHKMDDIVDPRKWIFGTMHHEVLNYYRNFNNTNIDINNIFEDAAVHFVNGFRDTRLIIEEAIDGIKVAKDRIIFDLIAIQNYTYRETATLTGTTFRHVRYRYGLVVSEVISFLNARGIKNIEDLL